MKNRKNIFYLFVIIFINLISLSGCFYSTPELVKKYEKQTVEMQNTKREEYDKFYVNEEYSFDILIEKNEDNEEVTVIYIYKDSKLEYKKEYPRGYITPYVSEYIVKDGILYFKVLIKENDDKVYSAIMKYDNYSLSISYIFERKFAFNEGIYQNEIMTNEYIYYLGDYREGNKYFTHIYVYDYDNTLRDEFIVDDDIRYPSIFETNEGFLFVNKSGVYSYANNEFKIIEEYNFDNIENIEYKKENNNLTFIGSNIELYEDNYSSYKKVTYFTYNNGDLKELISIDFPNDYYYRIQEIVMLENNALILICLYEKNAKSTFNRVLILNYDYEKVRCIYPNDSYHIIFKREDYIVFWKSNFNMFTKKETYKYNKILIDDIVNASI